MIRHIVLVRFDTKTSAAEIGAVLADLRALTSIVPGMLDFKASANVSPEGLADGFTHAFTADFAGAADRDAYLIHPAHRAAGDRLVRAAENGVAGLLVLDIDVV